MSKNRNYLVEELGKYREIANIIISDSELGHEEILGALYALKVHFQLVAYNKMNNERNLLVKGKSI